MDSRETSHFSKAKVTQNGEGKKFFRKGTNNKVVE